MFISQPLLCDCKKLQIDGANAMKHNPSHVFGHLLILNIARNLISVPASYLISSLFWNQGLPEPGIASREKTIWSRGMKNLKIKKPCGPFSPVSSRY